MTRRWAAIGFLWVAAGGACGGDGSTFSSGLEKEAELGSLSPTDVNKLCQSLNTWVQEQLVGTLKESSCRGSGISAGGRAPAAQKEAACTTAYNQCKAEPAEPSSSPTDSCEAPPASCRATVGEFEACINEFGGLLQQTVNAVPTCQQFASGATAMPPTLQPPAACDAISAKCPSFDLPGSSTRQ